MKSIKEKYVDVLHNFINTEEEEKLYQIYGLAKDFVQKGVTAEEVVDWHFDAICSVSQDLFPEIDLRVLNRCQVFLLEMLVTHGVYSGRNIREDLDYWRETVSSLSSRLTFVKNKHQMILDMIPVGITTINRDGVITFANKAWEELYKIEASAAIGHRLVDVIGDGLSCREDGTYILKTVETLETGMEFQDFEHQELDGRFFLISTSIIRDEKGDIDEVIAFKINITRRKQLEQGLIRSEKLAAVGALAAGIAHEVRNPLTVIRGFAQLMQGENLSSARINEYLTVILQEIDRANQVLSDFLCFARPNIPRLCPIRLDVILDEIRQLTEGEVLIREIDLAVLLPPAVPEVCVDKNQIKQALLNIVKNAFEAVELGGLVFLSVCWQKGESKAQVIIEDNGQGMDAETVSNIFEPFYTGKEYGTGLGLCVTFQIIQNHGGEINVSSSLGHGTRVIVSLPVWG